MAGGEKHLHLAGDQPSVGMQREVRGSAEREVATCIGAGRLLGHRQDVTNNQALEMLGKKSPCGSGEHEF